MPVPAALDADLTRLPSSAGRHLRRTAAVLTGLIPATRGATPARSSVPPAPHPDHGGAATCCCPCSVELPGEAA